MGADLKVVISWIDNSNKITTNVLFDQRMRNDNLGFDKWDKLAIAVSNWTNVKEVCFEYKTDHIEKVYFYGHNNYLHGYIDERLNDPIQGIYLTYNRHNVYTCDTKFITIPHDIATAIPSIRLKAFVRHWSCNEYRVVVGEMFGEMNYDFLIDIKEEYL
jgi:hypothetical protein